MKKWSYNPGEQVWFNDSAYSVVATGKDPFASGEVPVVFIADEKFKEVIPVRVAQVEPLITEQFAIGDSVEGAASFRGMITGFELETNRAICRGSKRAGKDRVRYAYKYNELTKIEPKEVSASESTQLSIFIKQELTTLPTNFHFVLGRAYELHSPDNVARVIVKKFPQTQQNGLPILHLQDLKNNHTVAIAPAVSMMHDSYCVSSKDLPVTAVYQLGVPTPSTNALAFKA